MEHAHQAREHLRSLVMVDPQVVFIVKRLALLEDRAEKATYLFLVALPLSECQGLAVKASFRSAASIGRCRSVILLIASLEWDIAEDYAHVFR